MKSVFSLVLILSSFGSPAQSCETDGIKPKPGPYGYKPRSSGHCEGIFTEKVSSKSLDMLSFTQGKIRYFHSPSEVLTIKSPAAIANAPWKARGINFAMNDSYRLDLTLGTSGRKINTKEVLVPVKITEKNLGIYGFDDSQGTMIYCPLLVSSELYDNQIPEQDRFFVKFISNLLVDRAEWRIARWLDGACDSFSSYAPVSGSQFGPEVPIEITLPASVPSGRICLEVRFRSTAGEWSTRRFTLLIP